MIVSNTSTFFTEISFPEVNSLMASLRWWRLTADASERIVVDSLMLINRFRSCQHNRGNTQGLRLAPASTISWLHLQRSSICRCCIRLRVRGPQNCLPPPRWWLHLLDNDDPRIRACRAVCGVQWFRFLVRPVTWGRQMPLNDHQNPFTLLGHLRYAHFFPNVFIGTSPFGIPTDRQRTEAKAATGELPVPATAPAELLRLTTRWFEVCTEIG